MRGSGFAPRLAPRQAEQRDLRTSKGEVRRRYRSTQVRDRGGIRSTGAWALTRADESRPHDQPDEPSMTRTARPESHDVTSILTLCQLLCRYPLGFQAGSLGCMQPRESVARTANRWIPADVGVHVYH